MCKKVEIPSEIIDEFEDTVSLCLSFDLAALELFSEIVGSIPAPWPWSPRCLDSHEDIYAQKDNSDFAEWTSTPLVKVRDFLATTKYGDPYFRTSILIPPCSNLQEAGSRLHLLAEGGFYASLEKWKSYLVLVRDCGYCGASLFDDPFLWIMTFPIEKSSVVDKFLSTATNHGCNVFMLTLHHDGLYQSHL